MKIKKANRCDLHSVAEFLHNCWQSEYRQIISDDYLDAMSIDERYKGLLNRYDDKVWEFSMLIDGDKLIGATVYGKSFIDGYKEDGEISAIYLHSDYIGRGYGHFFFTKIEEELTEKGYTHFILDVLADNIRAIKFYLSHGYKIIENRHVQLGDKEYPLTVMRKEANL